MAQTPQPASTSISSQGAFPWSSWEVASTSPTSSSFSSTVPPTLYVCWWDFHDGGPLENVTMIVWVLCSRLGWITRLASVSACLVIAKPIVAESPSVAEASLPRTHTAASSMSLQSGTFALFHWCVQGVCIHNACLGVALPRGDHQRSFIVQVPSTTESRAQLV